MLTNRSMPEAMIIPELGYANVREAAAFLCRAFGFTVRLRIADHRVQLTLGGGALVVKEKREGEGASAVMVRVDDADAHCARAKREGARIVSAPTDYPFGERQYVAEDPGGHRWHFSQSIADVDPATWGGSRE